MHFFRACAVVLTATVLVACSGSPDAPDLAPDVDWDVIASLSDKDSQVSWVDGVQPVLEQRCIVCHGCFDAPCQLKLTSFEGLERGANPEKVYNGSRIKAAQPTRLGIDASTSDEWDAMGFHPVLGASPGESAEDTAQGLRDSVLYRMLRLKQLNPQPRTGLLPESVTTNLDREQVCTNQEDMAKFERKNPLWGMPYGMPNLADTEYRTLVAWLAHGAEAPPAAMPAAVVAPQIERWEAFLNGRSNKERLVGRYLYEHLFLGHLYFEGPANREFYRLVRSSTPPGQPIKELATVRPFADPGLGEFWYRLRLYDATIVAKSHIVYSLSDERLARYKQLFIEPDYEVKELPSYTMPDAANPIKTYVAMPVQSRYEFMLDEARFFIMGFIKGPVCRGQVALNVIEDQFWVFFADPEGMGQSEELGKALYEASDYMQMPTSTQTYRLLASYGKFWEGQKKYLAARENYFEKVYGEKGNEAFSGIWNGGGTNPNAALTIFRNFDSAAVEFGLLGDYPETSWIIDYPLFERIHYLLVAGFDVYGNVGHQLNSRLFMDFLRMEGEDNFLAYLPLDKRKVIRDGWYKGIREKRSKYFQEPMLWSQIESPIAFKTQDPQRELYQFIETYLSGAAGPTDYLNRCGQAGCVSAGATESVRRADEIIKGVHDVDRSELLEERQYLNVAPDVLFLRIRMEGEPDIHYSILRNKSYANLSSLLESGASSERDPLNDTYSVLRGFSGAYPNFFLSTTLAELPDLVQEFTSMSSLVHYQKFVARYGIRRTNPEFWATSDWFHERFAEEQPVEYGVLDLNRYGNY